MSRLIALLAIACAVPLAICQKTWECVYIQKAAPPRVYSFTAANNNTGLINSEVKDAIVVLEDMCKSYGAVVVGVKLQICDEEAPIVTIPYEYPIWSMLISRKKSGTYAATVDIMQYCKHCGQCKFSEICTNPPVATTLEEIVSYDMYEKDKLMQTSPVPLT